MSATENNKLASPLLTCQQGATYLGLSKSAFWSKCRAGEISYIRLSSRCYRVRLSDIESFINSRYFKQEEVA
jgi:predicted DNA-binding transcriptional regulator AlpA